MQYIITCVFTAIAIVMAIAFTGLIYGEIKLCNEFPIGTKVKYLDSDIVGKVNNTTFPMIKISYVDDFNVIQTAEVNYRLVTKVK